jgi:hypothetical protein
MDSGQQRSEMNFNQKPDSANTDTCSSHAGIVGNSSAFFRYQQQTVRAAGSGTFPHTDFHASRLP